MEKLYGTTGNVTLSTLADGQAEALFKRALAEVVENIVDPESNAEVPREITLKIQIKPDERRHVASIVVSVATKLPARAAGTFWSFKAIGMTGRFAAIEQTQGEMFPAP